LRTPLTAIKGYQQLIKKGELTEEQYKKLDIAQKHTEELGQLIEHFFEYSYLTNAEPEMNLERINLTNLVTECLVASIPTIEERKITVHFEETSPIFVLVDKEMVLRIIYNLIRNCTEHSIGEIQVQLQVYENAVISFKNPVKDALIINVNQLFDRFYTSDQARSKSTGLGLAIVKLLAEKMGGGAEAALQNEILDIRVSLPLYERGY
jgi:signal transduction histidine kinase